MTESPDGRKDCECGPGNGWLAWLVPELGATRVCCEHDDAYSAGGHRSARLEADRRFAWGLIELALDREGLVLLLAAPLYYLGVRLGGWWAWGTSIRDRAYWRR